MTTLPKNLWQTLFGNPHTHFGDPHLWQYPPHVTQAPATASRVMNQYKQALANTSPAPAPASVELPYLNDVKNATDRLREKTNLYDITCPDCGWNTVVHPDPEEYQEELRAVRIALAAYSAFVEQQARVVERRMEISEAHMILERERRLSEEPRSTTRSFRPDGFKQHYCPRCLEAAICMLTPAMGRK